MHFFKILLIHMTFPDLEKSPSKIFLNIGGAFKFLNKKVFHEYLQSTKLYHVSLQTWTLFDLLFHICVIGHNPFLAEEGGGRVPHGRCETHA